MTEALTLKGMESLTSQFKALVSKKEKEIAQRRKQVAEMLTDALVSFSPVWSGRTIRSIKWSNDGSQASIEVHPDRGDTATEGWFRYHQEFGATGKMPLGVEPQRASAEAVAYSSLTTISYDIDKKVFVTTNSTASARVKDGTAPTEGLSRNKGYKPLEATAVAFVKLAFPDVRSL